MPLNRFSKICFEKLKSISSQNPVNSRNWFSRIKLILTSCDKSNFWFPLIQPFSNINAHLVLDSYKIVQHDMDCIDLINSSALQFLPNIQLNLDTQPYLRLYLPLHITSTVAQLRVMNIYNPRMIFEKNFYKFDNSTQCDKCNCPESNTLLHFLNSCPLYDALKEKYFGSAHYDILVNILTNPTPYILKKFVSYMRSALALHEST